MIRLIFLAYIGGVVCPLFWHFLINRSRDFCATATGFDGSLLSGTWHSLWSYRLPRDTFSADRIRLCWESAVNLLT
jgi:hypothetical protein